MSAIRSPIQNVEESEYYKIGMMSIDRSFGATPSAGLAESLFTLHLFVFYVFYKYESRIAD